MFPTESARTAPRGNLRTAKRRRPAAQKFLLSVGSFLSVATLLLAGVSYMGLRRYNDIEFVGIEGVTKSDSPVSNWLLVGTDSREGIDVDHPNAQAFLASEVKGKRTDTIMIARVDSQAKSIDLLSVPRDLWVTVAGTNSQGRINAVYNSDNGRERLVATIETNLGLEINHYAEINFVGFQEIVDTLGGVPICFDHPARDQDSGLNVEAAGCPTLEGPQALAFARSRSFQTLEDGTWRTDGSGDIGRTERQRYFLSQVVASATTSFDVSEIGNLNQVLSVGGKNLVIDDSAGLNDLYTLAKTFSDVGGDNIVGHGLPVVNFRSEGGAKVLRLDGSARETLDIFRYDGSVPRQVVVSVYNGARVPGQAKQAADTLELQGFTIGQISNADEVYVQTTIVHSPRNVAQAQKLAQSFTSAQLLQDSQVADIQLYTGQDFEFKSN